MIQLLFSLLFSEVAVVFLLFMKTPLLKLVIASLDRVKRGRGVVMVKTIAGTIFVVLVSSIYSMTKIRKRSLNTATDEVLMVKHLLEASLMGFSLFVALVIDRLHHYIRELRGLRKNMEATKKQNSGFEDGKSKGLEERKALDEEIAGLRAKVKQLELEAETRKRDTKSV
ncbi:uncharacterized protein LOC143889226 [Tasmannia lanceolata]|uniref:uncharacterized protein LOC143889226 n=1 Tax=Tasmannia lanceolata TaxID=3420 RepID=UPI0040639962